MIFYPLRPSPLILMLIVSFGLWLAFANIIIFLLASFLFVTITPVYVKFLFTILDHRANGLEGAPKLSVEMIHPFGEWRPYQLLFVIATLYFCIGELFTNEYIALGKFTLIYCLVALPAIISLMTMSHSIRIALNPISQLKFIKIVGFQYWLLLACIALGALLTNFLIEKEYTPFLIIFSILYTTVLTFNWLGIIIFSRRIALDFIATNSPEIKEQALEETLQSARTMCLYRACREYPSDNALAIILKYIENEEKNVLMAHQWFANELAQLENKGFAKCHREVHINALYSAGKTAMADLLKEQNLNKGVHTI